MKRRAILRAAASIPALRPGAATAAPPVTDDISEGYFGALPDTKAERNDAVVGCATELCAARNTVSETALDAVVAGSGSADDILRRLRFGVRILNTYDITNAIDEGMIETGERDLRDYTRYIPLVESYNSLCSAACAIEPPDPKPETVMSFLFAAAAFGLEVALWTVGAPYKMAWGGTRFVANRTFLRFAKYGCRGCIALLMSELHWAIRGSIYGEVVTENTIEFVWAQLQDLQRDAERWDYDVELAYSYAEIQEIVVSREPQHGGALGPLPQENEGPIERLLSDIEFPNLDFDIDLPDLTDLLP
ncbi:hypothetical protein [Haloglomus salinum]|uniref:hypothetical protein n=1 Tax=Haloglomus salinum TaxID=2962673 RepID=UPI0020C97153|nr:hypothetical protein [Haloglomus salinum]